MILLVVKGDLEIDFGGEPKVVDFVFNQNLRPQKGRH